jgi:hypothetical protein
MIRSFAPCLCLALSIAACDSPKESAAGGAASATATARPAVQLVVRTVSLQKTVTAAPEPGVDEAETFTALAGKVYAVVSADIAHNDCKDGDTVDSKLASLIVDGKPAGEVQGGGEDATRLCVLCQAKAPSGCSGGRAKLRPFTFVFAVDEKADMKKAMLRYKGADAKLEVAEITDRRGNEELDGKIAEKREQIAAMKKKLENTGNVSRGHIIEGEIQSIENEIKELEAKKK